MSITFRKGAAPLGPGEWRPAMLVGRAGAVIACPNCSAEVPVDRDLVLEGPGAFACACGTAGDIVLEATP